MGAFVVVELGWLMGGVDPSVRASQATTRVIHCNSERAHRAVVGGGAEAQALGEERQRAHRPWGVDVCVCLIVLSG